MNHYYEPEKEIRMDNDLRMKIAELKHRLYSEIPPCAELNVNQRLIVQGLLFDAVDEAVALCEEHQE